MATPQTLFKERAHWLKRDLREGTVQHSELSEYIRNDWEKDEDEYRDAYGVTSFAQFKAGVMAAIGPEKRARPAKQKRIKKAPVKQKRTTAAELKRRACASKRIPAFLKRFC